MEEQQVQYCIRVIFNESFNILPVETVKSLSFVSRSIHNTVKQFIENNYWFVLRNKERRTTHFQPKKVRGIEDLSQITLLPYEVNDTHKQNFVNNITHLKFSDYFNQTVVENLLPVNTTHLWFGLKFNRCIKNFTLPLNLTHLHFSFRFNQPIEKLPPKVVQVVFRGDPPYFNQPVSHLNTNIKFHIINYREVTKPYEYNPN